MSKNDTQTIDVVIIQPDLAWLDPDANLLSLEQYLPKDFIGAKQPGLVVLPEMFSAGFIDYPQCSPNEEPVLQWMQAQARRYNIALVGSVAYTIDEDKPVNRLLFVMPDQSVQFYDKVHLFRMADEHQRYQAGQARCIVKFAHWRILLTICYDIRFPVFCRNRDDYDMVLCVANWPASRRRAWRVLLQARAIENQACVIGVNRVGVDGHGLYYHGDSMVVDAAGAILADGGDGKAGALRARLCLDALRQVRASFPVWKDADPFQLFCR